MENEMEKSNFFSRPFDLDNCDARVLSITPFLSSFAAKLSSGNTETKQWSDMIAKPRQAVVVWHRLKPGD